MSVQLNSNPATGGKMSGWIRTNIRSYSMIFALVGLWLLFSALTHGLFITPRNLSNLFEQSSETAILAVGMTLVIICSEIDLSVGSLTGLTGGIAAMCQVWWHMSTIMAVLVALVVGLAIGLLQGWWVAYQKVPSFIVTLGGMLIFSGVLIGLTSGTSIAPLSNTFMNIGQGYVPNGVNIVLGVVVLAVFMWISIRNRRQQISFGFEVRSSSTQWFMRIGIIILVAAFVYIMNLYAGIPVPVFILLILAGIFTFIAMRSKFGRQLYAIGGNREAARMSGIPVNRRILTVFALSGLLAGVTGVVCVARLGAGTVDAGTNYELDAIAACVIGGSSLLGGVGTIFGSIIGAIVMGTIDNGMSLMDAAPFWEYVVKGLILILAVWIDMTSKRIESN